MSDLSKIVIVVSLFVAAHCSPYDDGKWKHKKYDAYDDGKYYRPRTEGKYVPGDEGKYTYIYQKGVWPYDGTYKHLEVGDNEYAIYAPRFPYTYSAINALTDAYESPDILTLGDFGLGVPNYFGAYHAQQEKLQEVKHDNNGRYDNSGKYVHGGDNGKYVKEQPRKPASPNTEAINQYFTPTLKLKEGEKLGTVYNYKGTKVLTTAEEARNKKLKLEYEVFIRIVDDLKKRK
ncbi:uncharacterized protein LOC121731054 [Aricia agestis]|uniref:uncharacterized protein LOC121731054 n=1 Tax=Aricia agestis TaxID=91739 RepID=UPI001C209605|nr:uncharacterized protein LOC121731054 [Aricia agestis]XP_041976306.1 uncharacterized protein LOC121731054 [Aricia agestis]